MREVLLTSPVDRDGISYPAGAVVQFEDAIGNALIASSQATIGSAVLIALSRSAPRYNHAGQVARLIIASMATGGPRAITTTVSSAATGVILTVAHLLGSSSSLSLVAGTNSNLKMVGDAITATAAIGDGSSQVAVVREAAGLLAVEYPVTFTGKAPVVTPTPSPTPTPTPTPGGAPTITGTAGEGNRLMADTYGWTDSPEYRSGQWYRDGVAIDGATFRSYTQQAGDVGKALTYTAKSRLDGVQRTTVPSAPITPTAAAAFSLDQFPAGTLIDHDPAVGVVVDGSQNVTSWPARRGAGTFTSPATANSAVLRQNELGADPAVFLGSSSTVGRQIISDETDSTYWVDAQVLIRGGKEASNQPSVNNNKTFFVTRRAADGYTATLRTPGNTTDTNQNIATIGGIGGGSNASSTQFAKGVPSIVTITAQPIKRRASVNGAAGFGTTASGTTVGPATGFGSAGTDGPIVSIVRRLRLSLDTLAGSYSQLAYHRLLEGHLAWRYGQQALLDPATPYATRPPSAADFLNKMANIQTWGNSLTNGFSIHINNVVGTGDTKGRYGFNGGVGGETAGQIWDRFNNGFDTGVGTTTGESIAIQRSRVSVIGDVYTNGFGATSTGGVTSSREVVAAMVAAVEAAQGVTAGNGRIVVLSRWRTPIQGLNDPATDSIVAEDNYLRATFPNYFCDWVDYLWSLGAPDGLYPDPVAYARHNLPDGLRADNTHPTGTGYQLLGTYIGNFIKAKGWDRA